MGQSSPFEGLNLLDLTPIRVANWFENEGDVVVIRPRPTSRSWRTPFEWMSYLMTASRLRLDSKGSFAWRRMDGTNSVLEVAEQLRVEFGEEIEPAEERVGILIRQLRAEELVLYSGLDPLREPGADVGEA